MLRILKQFFFLGGTVFQLHSGSDTNLNQHLRSVLLKFVHSYLKLISDINSWIQFPADLNQLRRICRASATGNHNKNNIIAGIESRLLPGWIRGSLQLICFRVFGLARESLQKVLKALQAVQKESNGF